MAAQVQAQEMSVVSALYADPTDRYAHGILGDAIEYGTLTMQIAACETCAGHQVQVVLPETHVFEDTAPRIFDVNGDGNLDVVVVETQMTQGARLAVYDATGAVIAATPYIGRTHRWLAPVGVGDLDGDGTIELAYVDRPHLAKTLRVWRYTDSGLVEMAALSGVTNHRIGETDIAGGIRDCGDGPEMIVATADWRRLIAVRFEDDTLTHRDIGAHRDRGSFSAALACAD